VPVHEIYLAIFFWLIQVDEKIPIDILYYSRVHFFQMKLREVKEGRIKGYTLFNFKLTIQKDNLICHEYVSDIGWHLTVGHAQFQNTVTHHIPHQYYMDIIFTMI